MKHDRTKKTISLSFRIDEELNTRIEEKADKANRTKSNFVINLITNALDNMDKQNDLMR